MKYVVKVKKWSITNESMEFIVCKNDNEKYYKVLSYTKNGAYNLEILFEFNFVDLDLDQ